MADSRWDAGLIFALFMVVVHFKEVSLFSMLSRGQMHVLNAGDDVSLECEFYTDKFDLFYNPILWEKIQHHETTEMNIMGNIKEPFESTGKFEVTFNPLPPRYMLELTISNVSMEDSANYSCEVRAPGSKIFGHVTHRIFIRAPVVDVSILDEIAATPTEEYFISASKLSFIEDKPRAVQCVAKGGNPPPQVEVMMGRHDVTDQFDVEMFPKMTGQRGFRLMSTTTVITATRFRAGAVDDGKRFKCKVTVPGMGSQTASAKVQVQYAPTIYCKPAAAHLGQKNINLTCEVRARPGITALFWTLDNNGTVVAEGEVVNEYWIINMVQGDGSIQSKLFMRLARHDSFRPYTLVAENTVAVTTRSVELRQLHKDPKPKPQTVAGPDEHRSHRVTDNRRDHTDYLFIPTAGGSISSQSGSLPIYIAAYLAWFLLNK